ncbi:DJ-1/PfpI family protein [Plantactinospora mayteni]|uniref:Glutamine amidotransferase n=1 Tax=Plantactinospora mayteni TaxID=566021 RepID=A0ABQ4F0L7_9ACTN|nr:DJ-1/PfpI family protein [Plantactinospora mayteni]GIH00449.1 glutamine amidotransferase [Plantactinospora mayteni]
MAELDQGRRAILRAAVAGGAGVGLGAALAAPATAGDRDDGSRPERRLRIAILLYDGFTALDVVGPYEVLCRVPNASVVTVAKRTGPVRTDTQVLALTADRSLRQVPEVDVLVVPGAGDRGVLAAMADAETMDWIRRIHRRTTWTTSVCTGALLLGAAGLLRGLPATTYWASRGYLESQFGAVVVPERVVQTGKIITAAGVSAGIDMALRLAARLADERVAQALQLAVEYDPQPPYDTGNPEQAGPELQQLALKLLADAAR